MNTNESKSGKKQKTVDGSVAIRTPTLFDRPVMSVGLRLATLFDELLDVVAPTPWVAHAGITNAQRMHRAMAPTSAPLPLYSREERERRDASPWTLVQAVLAPTQFLTFAISAILVTRYLITGDGYLATTISIVAKTILLYAIMFTGSIWEKHVFGKWLFARAFFWEDVFSMLVLFLQTTYLICLITGWATPRQQMIIAISAYATYVINAAQFLLKLRAARLEGAVQSGHGGPRNEQIA